MSLSVFSHQADFCCHAATQSPSIILRSIKRCGYPGRRESCLSFRSLFFPPHFCLFRLTTPSPSAYLPFPVSYTWPPSTLPLSFLYPFFHPLCPLFSALRTPSTDDGVSQHQGILPSCLSSSLLSFLCKVFGFMEHDTLANIVWNIPPPSWSAYYMFLPLLQAAAISFINALPPHC